MLSACGECLIDKSFFFFYMGARHRNNLGMEDINSRLFNRKKNCGNQSSFRVLCDISLVQVQQRTPNSID